MVGSASAVVVIKATDSKLMSMDVSASAADILVRPQPADEEDG